MQLPYKRLGTAHQSNSIKTIRLTKPNLSVRPPSCRALVELKTDDGKLTVQRLVG
jgi:hypothetical protein